MVGIIDITNVDSVHPVGRTECVGGSKRERLPPLKRTRTLPTASNFNGVIIIIELVFSITDVTVFNLVYYTGTDREGAVWAKSDPTDCVSWSEFSR